MGNTCKSVADHVNVWQKLLQYCKIISLQLIKKKSFTVQSTTGKINNTVSVLPIFIINGQKYVKIFTLMQ